MQSVIRAIQSNNPLLTTIIEKNIERPGCSNDKLVAYFMGVCTPGFSPGNIIKIKNTTYLKWQILPSV